MSKPTEKDQTRKLHGLPEPGETPIPPDHIRLYHQTNRENLDQIQKHGIRMDRAKGIEGPKSVYASETGFYGKPDKTPSAEFHIPKKEWHGNGQIPRSIEPHEIIATHHPWHRHARYLIRHPDSHAKLMQGHYDKLTGDEKTAGEYVKKHHPTLE